MSMVLYRAMCKEEAARSIAAGRPQFVSRYKWFSPFREFVTQRVQDGVFNNSRFKQWRYTEVLEFTFSDESLPYFNQNGKEYMLDRRDSQMVRCEVVGDLEVRR